MSKSLCPPTFKGPVDSSFLLSTFWPFIRANWIRPNFLPKHRVLRRINLQKQFKVLQASKQVSKNTSSFKINKMYAYGVTFASAEIPSMLILNLWIMIPCATFALKKYEVTVIWSQICPWSFYAEIMQLILIVVKVITQSWTSLKLDLNMPSDIHIKWFCYCFQLLKQ